MNLEEVSNSLSLDFQQWKYKADLKNYQKINITPYSTPNNFVVKLSNNDKWMIVSSHRNQSITFSYMAFARTRLCSDKYRGNYKIISSALHEIWPQASGRPYQPS